MGDKSGIEWTDATWNPTTGCDRITRGCDNCYALTLAARLKAMGSARYQNDGQPPTSGPGFGLTLQPDDVLFQPLRWNKPRLVFVNSMSDLFHARVPPDFIARVFAVMALAPRHTFQILTKRPIRMRAIVGAKDFRERVGAAATDILSRDGRRRFDLTGWIPVPGDGPAWWLPPWPLPNVWLGVSIESNEQAGRAWQLANTPAAGRFVSAEPLLDSIRSLDLTPIDWLIVGGESGPRARMLREGWVLDLINAAEASDTPVFVKQLGSHWARDTFIGGRSVSTRGDHKGGDPQWWDPLLRARDYPPAMERIIKS